MLHEPDVASWRLENVPESTMTLIRQFYDSGISDTSAQELIWWMRNQHFVLQELETREGMRLAKYENMVCDPATTFGQIFEFAGLRFVPKFTRSVLDNSVGKHKPPNIDGAIQELCDTMLGNLDRFWKSQSLEFVNK